MPDLAEIGAFIAQLRQEFVDSCLDRLTDLDRFLEKAIAEGGVSDDAMLDLRRHIHSIKGSAGTHGLSVVSQIAHRLEDYMDTCDAIGGPQLSGIQTHLDRIRDILETGHDPEPDAAAEMLRRLPAPVSPKRAPEKIVHVLLVMPKSVQRKIIAHELLGRGFQVSMVETALHALKVALAERPDLIVASQEIEDFPGVELARVCTDIAATAPCRFILMTSHRATDPALAGLPASAALIGKGPTFSRDLAARLAEWGM